MTDDLARELIATLRSLQAAIERMNAPVYVVSTNPAQTETPSYPVDYLTTCCTGEDHACTTPHECGEESP